RARARPHGRAVQRARRRHRRAAARAHHHLGRARWGRRRRRPHGGGHARGGAPPRRRRAGHRHRRRAGRAARRRRAGRTDEGVTVPTPTRAALGKREAALGVTAGVVVLLPLLVAGAVGHQVEQVAPGGTDLGGLDVLRHNLRLGLAIGVVGWLTLGVGAAGVAAVGSVASGYVLGAHVADLGWGATLALVPHLVPELLAFVAFTGAGLHG